MVLNGRIKKEFITIVLGEKGGTPALVQFSLREFPTIPQGVGGGHF